MQFDDLHKEIILDHYRNPRNKTSLADHDAVMDNPSCGDRVALKVVFGDDGRIAEVLFDGEGCSISMASASILTEILKGKTREEAAGCAAEIHSLFRGEGDDGDFERYGDLEALRGLVDYPVRLKCATLAWDTLDIFFKEESS